MSAKWVSIQEYSLNNSISISTIRRRIKAGRIKFKLVNGRYEIFDASVAAISGGASHSFSCPALKDMEVIENRIEELEKDNQRLKEENSELKMLLRVLEEKSGIRVSG